jgi:DICT domain-containing protein
VKNFSIFEEACKFSHEQSAEDLGHISSLSRRDFIERETFSFSSSGACIEYACLLIENALLLRTNRGGRIYAGFERMSGMKPVVERYLRIADLSESVWIFGEPDWTPPRHPNIRIVDLAAEFKLAHEWFLIADSSSLQVAIIARDEDELRNTASDRREFSAVKTSNPNGVSSLASASEALIDLSMALVG